MPPLMADGAQLGRFFDAMFRYADEGTFVSLRSFFDDDVDGVFSIRGHKLVANTRPLLHEIEAFANRCATSARPTVFCPPIATFRNQETADEVSLANGLALSVECDKSPVEARRRLETLLGPATVVIASGGEWTNPETGEIEDKLHLHWRLSEPTRGEAEHKRLKTARVYATRLVGGDASNKPIVHPIRWPGSWHRKAAPRLTATVDFTDAELHLDDALDLLESVIPTQAAAGSTSHETGDADGGEGEERNTAELVRAVLTAEEYHAPLVALAMRFLRGGMTDSQVVLTLRGIMLAIPEAYRDKKDGAPQQGRWQARYDDIPRAVATARSKIGPAPSAEVGRAPPATWGAPIDFFTDPNSQAPELQPEHIPQALTGFVMDTAARMGVDRTSVAMSCLAATASVMSDDWKVQPKRHDYTWNESPRIWIAILGDPSILKTPILAACTKPIDKLEAAARRRHADAMRQYKQRLADWKKDKENGVEPMQPKLDRFLIEGATVEAISEVLRDDDEATMNAPAGKVLCRQDEMSEFFANLDRYKAGGKGGGDRGAYLRLFNGGRYTIDRIMRGSFSVPNWSANFIGGMQPGPIQRVAKESAEDGLLQRFLYVVPGPQSVGLDRQPDHAAQDRYAALFPALAALHPPARPGSDDQQTVAFHTDAHGHREKVDALARAMALLPDTSPRLRAALGKWPGIYARLALIFHLVDVADSRARNETTEFPLVIPETTARQAAMFMAEIVLPHLLRADAMMFSSVQAKHAERVAGWILLNRLQHVKARDLIRNYKPFAAPEDKPTMKAVMEQLVLVNWLEPEVPSNPMRPVNSWLVNPAVHVKFEGHSAREGDRRRQAREMIQAAKDAFHRGNPKEPEGL